MEDRTISSVALDIIVVVSLWNISNAYYNIASIEQDPLNVNSIPFKCYLFFTSIATVGTIGILAKY